MIIRTAHFRDFGPLRVVVMPRAYEERIVNGGRNRIYWHRWHDGGGSWEFRFLWIEVRWRVHKGRRRK